MRQKLLAIALGIGMAVAVSSFEKTQGYGGQQGACNSCPVDAGCCGLGGTGTFTGCSFDSEGGRWCEYQCTGGDVSYCNARRGQILD
jgi:hypothetical protein